MRPIPTDDRPPPPPIATNTTSHLPERRVPPARFSVRLGFLSARLMRTVASGQLVAEHWANVHHEPRTAPSRVPPARVAGVAATRATADGKSRHQAPEAVDRSGRVGARVGGGRRMMWDEYDDALSAQFPSYPPPERPATRLRRRRCLRRRRLTRDPSRRSQRRCSRRRCGVGVRCRRVVCPPSAYTRATTSPHLPFVERER